MMGLYFANEVTVDMGPTCIVPESQYYEVDRLHWSTLGTHKEPPALTTDPGRESWEAECSRVGRVCSVSCWHVLVIGCRMYPMRCREEIKQCSIRVRGLFARAVEPTGIGCM